MKHAKAIRGTKHIANKPAPGNAPHIKSPNDRAAAVKALCEKLAREQHNHWKPSKGRPNLIEPLHKSDADRMKELAPICYGRMLESPSIAAPPA